VFDATFANEAAAGHGLPSCKRTAFVEWSSLRRRIPDFPSESAPAAAGSAFRLYLMSESKAAAISSRAIPASAARRRWPTGLSMQLSAG